MVRTFKTTIDSDEGETWISAFDEDGEETLRTVFDHENKDFSIYNLKHKVWQHLYGEDAEAMLSILKTHFDSPHEPEDLEE